MFDEVAPDDDAGFPRMLSRGRAFVYVLACRDDNVFKVGFCRDPLQRWRTLHRRYFDFFDLTRGLLVGTTHVRDAQRLERELHGALANYSALEPLAVTASAAGSTEWFRGALDDAVTAALDAAVAHDFEIHQPPATWLHSILLARKDLLFAWSGKLLEAIEYERHNASDDAQRHRYERALRDALDLFDALDIDVTSSIPPAVANWRCR
jgi:hypothetical protein